MNKWLIDAVKSGDHEKLFSLLTQREEAWLSYPLNTEKQTLLDLLLAHKEFALLKAVILYLHERYRLSYQSILDLTKSVCLLHHFVKYQQIGCLELFLEQGVGLNCQDQKGNTLLHIAVYYDHNDIVNVLLKKNIDLRTANHKGVRADQVGCHVKGKINYLYQQKQVFMEGIKKKELSVLKTFAEQSISWFLLPLKKYNHLAIHQVVIDNWHEGLAYILTQNLCDVNAIASMSSLREQSWTPLHYAAFHSSSKQVVDLLLQHGANVSSRDFYGFTPDLVGIAVYINRVRNRRDALYRAVLSGDFPMVKYYVKQNVSWLRLPLIERGKTALHYAAMANHREILRFMINALKEKGFQLKPILNTRDGNQLTILDYVALHDEEKPVTPITIEKLSNMLKHDFRLMMETHRRAKDLLKHPSVLKTQANTVDDMLKLLFVNPTLLSVLIADEKSFCNLQKMLSNNNFLAANFLSCLTYTLLGAYLTKIEMLFSKGTKPSMMTKVLANQLSTVYRSHVVMGDLAFFGLFRTAPNKEAAMHYYQQVSPRNLKDYLHAQYELAQHCLTKNKKQEAKKHFQHIIEQAKSRCNDSIVVDFYEHAMVMLSILNKEATDNIMPTLTQVSRP